MEVSEQFGLSSDTLRYYERIGLIPPVNRNGSGIRDYSELDLRRVEFIKCMRSAGLPVDQLLSMLAQHLPGTVDRASPTGALDESQFAASSDEADQEQDSNQDGGQGSLADQAGLGDIGRR